MHCLDGLSPTHMSPFWANVLLSSNWKNTPALLALKTSFGLYFLMSAATFSFHHLLTEFIDTSLLSPEIHLATTLHGSRKRFKHPTLAWKFSISSILAKSKAFSRFKGPVRGTFLERTSFENRCINVFKLWLTHPFSCSG